MSGSYGVGTNYLGFSVGGAGAAGTGAFTIAVLVQPGVGNNNAGFVGLYASTTLTRAIFESSNALFGPNDFSSGFGTLTQGNWYLCVITKLAGSNLYRFHLWAYNSGGTGSFSHGTSVGAANQGDGSTITQIRVGANAVQSNGLIACAGIWNRALSDAEIDTMVSVNLSTWKNVSGGQPAELISLENWNGTSGANTLIGTSAYSATTGTVSSGSNPPSFNFSLSGGPITGNLGQPSETDSGLTITRRKIITLGIPAEADSAQNTTRRKVRTLGIPSETDTAFTLKGLKQKTLGIPSETDTALPVTRRKSRTMGIPSETDTAFTIANRRKLKTLGLPGETDAPLGFGHTISSPLGLPSETDSALPMGRLKRKTLGIPTTTDSALGSWGRRKRWNLGLPVEFDLPLALVLPDVVVVLPDLVVRTVLPVTPVTTAPRVLTIRTGL